MKDYLKEKLAWQEERGDAVVELEIAADGGSEGAVFFGDLLI